MIFPNKLTRVILGISTKEALFENRGFDPGEADVRHHLEEIGMTFIRGYNAALEHSDQVELHHHLRAIENEYRGFAFEGASMALSLLDMLSLYRRNHLKSFLDNFGDEHIYMMHVGAGWALARMRRKPESFLSRMNPLLGWLMLDGYGFHEGYFNWQKSIERQLIPNRLRGYSRRVFDQGIGRSLWFVKCANVENIFHTIYSFPESRRTDLWSGVGLACAYAGGVKRNDIENLYDLTSTVENRVALAQGAAFAAKSRQRAGNPTSHTQMACEILCGVSADEAAQVTDLALRNLPQASDIPIYEIWRKRIQNSFKGVLVR